MKKETQLVSIIVTNWNGKDWLGKCLDSLIKQDYKRIEIILVDNDSTDGSVEFVKNRFSQVKIIQNKLNVGFPKALMIGIKKSKGKYSLIFNNDTWVNKSFVSKLVDYYENHDLDVIAPLEKRYFNQKFNKYNSTIDPLGSPAYYLPKYRKDKLFYLCGVCLFFSKDIYLETLGMDEDFFLYFEDTDWFWRLSLLGKKFAYVDNIFIYHAAAGSSNPNEKLKYKTFLLRNKNIPQMLIKNYSILPLIIVLIFYLIENLFEMLFFLIILKPNIASTYIKGWFYNIQNIKRTLGKRRWIQKRRVVGDIEIMKKMFLGSGKLLLLKDYLNEK